MSVSSKVPLSRKRDEPRKRRRGKFIDIDSDYRERSGLMNLETAARWVASHLRQFRKWMRNDSCSFFHGDDLIDRHIGQLVHLAAGPGDHERIDLRPLAKAEDECADRLPTCSSFRPWPARHAYKSFRGQLQHGADAVAVRLRADQQDLQPVIGVAAIVAQEARESRRARSRQ